MTDQIKCPHCGTTKTKKGPFESLSSLNTHINIHCPKNPNSKVGKAATGDDDLDDIDDPHKHKWTLLKPVSAAHARALNAGHTKICECGEVV